MLKIPPRVFLRFLHVILTQHFTTQHQKESLSLGLTKEWTVMIDSSGIALPSRYLELVRSIIRSSMGDAHGTVYLFGSRARGNPRPTSDIDLAVAIAAGDRGLVGRLRENIENSTIPYTVDIIDLDTCGSALADEVKREGVEIWSA
jgi:predicted nucleotidyltransferase